MKLKNKFFVTFLLSALLISNIQIISNAYEPDSFAPEINKNIVSSSARSDVTVKSINPVRYRKENVRKVYNAMNGKILGKNPYVVKKPVSYQYELCPDR